jgi:hypothetical protein
MNFTWEVTSNSNLCFNYCSNNMKGCQALPQSLTLLELITPCWQIWQPVISEKELGINTCVWKEDRLYQGLRSYLVLALFTQTRLTSRRTEPVCCRTETKHKPLDGKNTAPWVGGSMPGSSSDTFTARNSSLITHISRSLCQLLTLWRITGASTRLTS